MFKTIWNQLSRKTTQLWYVKTMVFLVVLSFGMGLNGWFNGQYVQFQMTYANCLDGDSECDKNINVQLQIENGFDSFHQWQWSLYSDGTISYTPSPWVDLQVGAVQSAQYTTQWPFVSSPLLWTGSGSFTQTYAITLIWPDGIKTIDSLFVSTSDNSLSQPDNLLIYLDTTPPSQASLLSTLLYTGLSWVWWSWTWSASSASPLVPTEYIRFERLPSSDGWSWLDEYTLYVSQYPSMIDPITFSTSQTSLTVETSLLPTGTLYRYIEATDNVWNSSASVPWFFTLSWGWWWGWQASSVTWSVGNLPTQWPNNPPSQANDPWSDSEDTDTEDPDSPEGTNPQPPSTNPTHNAPWPWSPDPWRTENKGTPLWPEDTPEDTPKDAPQIDQEIENQPETNTQNTIETLIGNNWTVGDIWSLSDTQYSFINKRAYGNMCCNFLWCRCFTKQGITIIASYPLPDWQYLIVYTYNTQHDHYPGVILRLNLVCYDIELYNRWMFLWRNL